MKQLFGSCPVGAAGLQGAGWGPGRAQASLPAATGPRTLPLKGRHQVTVSSSKPGPGTRRGTQLFTDYSFRGFSLGFRKQHKSFAGIETALIYFKSENN